MRSIEFIDSLKKDTHTIIDIVKSEFLNLNPRLFNSKPADKKWSIAECFQHLNLTLDVYIPQMIEIVHQKDRYIGKTKYFKHSIFRKIAVKSVTPKPDKRIPLRMKTFSKLDPKFSTGDKNEILGQFLKFQQHILETVHGIQEMSLTNPKIITAARPILKMGIGDALHFMIAHNQRHILQAQNVLKIIS